MYGLSAVLCKYGLQQGADLRGYSLRSILKFLINNKIWLLGVLLSFTTNIAIVELQSILDMSVVYPLLNFSYIFVLILGYLVLRESINQQQWIGVALVTLGTTLIIFIDSPATGKGTDVRILLLISLISVLGIGAILYTVYKQKVENYEIAFAICTGISLGNVETYVKANTNLVATELGHFSVFLLDSVLYFFSQWPFFMLVFFWRGGLGLHANHLLARQCLDYCSIIRGHSECVHPFLRIFSIWGVLWSSKTYRCFDYHFGCRGRDTLLCE